MGSDRSTILVIDDDAIIRSFFAEVLRREHQVIECGEGAKAVELFEADGRDRYDLVLLDLGMPHMSGYEALAKLQIMDPDVKVLVVTGLVPDQERLPGVVLILQKPVGVDQLLDAVRSALDA